MERWTSKPSLDHAIDDALNLLLGGALLHYDKHLTFLHPLSSARVRISSMMRSKMRLTARPAAARGCAR